MRILVISQNFSDDLERQVHGTYQRSGMFLDALKDLGRLDLLFFVQRNIDLSADSVARYRRMLSEHLGVEVDLTLVTQEQPPEPSRWTIYGAGMLDAFRQKRLYYVHGPRSRQALKDALDRRPDLLFVHELGPMAPVLASRDPLPPVFLDLNDVGHIAFPRIIRQTITRRAERLFYMQIPALWWAERRAISLAKRTFVCSERDRKYLKFTMLVGGVRAIKNAVQMPEYCGPASEQLAMFIGHLRYEPNSHAATYLLEEIWPRVRKQLPQAQLVIGGDYAERVPGYPGGEGVTFPGFVEDLLGLYRQTRVVCVPITAGGGTRIKIIEAAGYGLPIVSTTIGAEGLDLEDGRHLLLRDDPDSFADAVVELLRDGDKGRILGLAAREAVLHTYSRVRIVEEIRKEIGSRDSARRTPRVT